MYGATSGEVSISKLNGAINQAVLTIIPNNGYNSKFIEQWLLKNKKTICDTYLQGGQGNLSGEIVKNLSITLPIEHEQKKYDKFFTNLDNLITLHQHKSSVS